MGIDPITMMAISAGMQASSAYSGARAQKNALNSQAGVYDSNAQVALWQQEQAIQDGIVAENQSREKTAQLKSTQRASLAANGVDLGEGSANDILAGTDLIGGQDAAQIRLNAMRQAWGYENSAIASKNQAAGARAAANQINPTMAVATSLLNSATGVSREQYARRKTGGTTAGWVSGYDLQK
jgi:hypothetical protein